MKQQNLNSIKHEPKSANKEPGDAQHMRNQEEARGDKNLQDIADAIAVFDNETEDKRRILILFLRGL